MSAPLTYGERVLMRTLSLMANGKARSWSHAIELAANTLKPNEPPKGKTK